MLAKMAQNHNSQQRHDPACGLQGCRRKAIRISIVSQMAVAWQRCSTANGTI